MCKLLYGMTQGLNPFFSFYTSSLAELLGGEITKFYFYADDTELYIHLAHENAAAESQKLNQYLHNVKHILHIREFVNNVS